VDEKHALEYNVVEALQTAKPSLPIRSFEVSNNPEVDVLLTLIDGGIVGVEVTQLHPGGQQAHRWESARRKVVDRAQRLYACRSLPNLSVVVSWSTGCQPTKRQQYALAEKLAAFVADHVPAVNEILEFQQYDEPLPAPPVGIERLLIRRFFQLPNHWDDPRSAWVGDLSVETIRERLVAKEKKPSKYLGSYKEHWLVLAVGTGGPSTWANVPLHLEEVTFASTFHRVFVVHPLALAIELRVGRAEEYASG